MEIEIEINMEIEMKINIGDRCRDACLSFDFFLF